MARSSGVLCISLLAVLLALSTGCGEEASLPPGTVRVTFWHSMSGPLGKALRTLIDKFEREHPKIRIRSVFQGGYGQLSQKVNLSLINGSPPDMAQMYEAMIAFCNRSEPTILPLDGFLQQDRSLDFQDIFAPFRETITQDGRVYSLPPTKSFPVLYWNRELFEAAGLERAPASWAELAEFGRRLTRDLDGDGAPDQWGWAFVTDAWIFECMVLQEGGSFLDEQGNSALGGRPALESMRFMLDAVQGEEPYAYRTTGFDHQGDFAEGKVAMVIGSTVSRTFMEDQIEFRSGVSPLPQGSRKASIMAGPNIAIFADRPPENQRAAYEFLKFFTSTKSTLYWAMATNYVPIRRSAVESETFQRRIRSDPGFAAGIEQIEYAVSEPPLPGWYECRQILNNAIRRSLAKPESMEDTFAGAVDEMNRVLEVERQRAHQAREAVDGDPEVEP